MFIIQKLQSILWKTFLGHFAGAHSSRRVLLINYRCNDLVAPGRDGLHLGDVEYDNTLSVLSVVERSMQIREEVVMADGFLEE